MDEPQPRASCGQKSLNFAVSRWDSSSAMAAQKIQKCSASPPVDRHLPSHLEGHKHPSSHLKGHYPPLSDEDRSQSQVRPQSQDFENLDRTGVTA